jgi:hypothetical protein
MTVAEFKAWFEGFTETLEVAPNEKQWERIKARVAEINGTVTTYPVFVDRYVEPYRRWLDYPMVFGGSPVVSCSSGQSMARGVGSTSFDAGSAMMDLGKAEYRSLDS